MTEQAQERACVVALVLIGLVGILLILVAS